MMRFRSVNQHIVAGGNKGKYFCLYCRSVDDPDYKERMYKELFIEFVEVFVAAITVEAVR